MFFGHFFTRHRRFASRVILFQTRHEKNVFHKHSALKTCLNADTHSQPALPPLLTVNLNPSSRRSFNLHPFPLAVNLTTPQPAVILYPSSWQSNSPLPDQRSSSPPSGSQMQLSPRSGHPPPLLVVKFTPPRPAVILHPCWRSTSPLPPAIGCFKGRGIKKGGLMKRGDERREAEDGIREAKDGRREMW